MSAHSYPSLHRPGTHWATDIAWEILDVLPVGTLNLDQRSFVAGLIAGSLLRVRDGAGADNLLRLLRGSLHALKSYAAGNASPELAREIAEAVERALAETDPGAGR